jgi:hypothetical protein
MIFQSLLRVFQEAATPAKPSEETAKGSGGLKTVFDIS